MPLKNLFYLLRNLSRRPRCVLTGCRAENQATGCDKCGADLYEEWINASLCCPVQRWWSSLLIRLDGRCAGCGKRLPFRRRLRFEDWPAFCDEACEEGWIPF